MSNLQRLQVTCLNCQESDVITVDKSPYLPHPAVVDYAKKINTPFRSFRWRPDLKWGFFCQCLNDNRLAPEEKDDMHNLVAGDPLSVERIARSLEIPDEQQFKTVAV